MNTNEKEKKPQSDRERGVAENEKANYSGFPREEESKEEDDKDDKDDIKETDRSDKREKGAGDIAGNAAGNTPADEE